MSSYKDIIQKAGEAVHSSAIADLITTLWDQVEWQAYKTELPGSKAELSVTGQLSIALYPSLFESAAPVNLVLAQFGNLVFLNSGDQGVSVWEKKLDIPLDEHIELASEKLKDETIRTLSSCYADVLGNYPDRGHSVDRLVYINIANALLANNVSYADSVGVDIRTWGPTAEYCTGKKYHSLIPLVSAYSPAEVSRDFGVAFQQMLTDDLQSVRDKSVAYALRGMIQRIAKLAD